MKWLHRIEAKEGGYSVEHYRFVSDGKETKADILFLIDFADRWYGLYEEQIIVNYDELKKRLESMK